ncbi:MAG: ribonuclease PH [Deltaproteobacteria bacterium]|nr:ribonuclease PH [Deltaproteobacteria bacterium]
MITKRTRPATELREVTITPGYLKPPEGSALIRAGDTMVVCTASVEDKVKDWMRGQGRGWITAEYAMLPRANASRGLREGQFGRWPSSRSQEIQRLIGRALRGIVWPKRLGERSITIDCDVLQADGGTRTASITGGFVALALALDRLRKAGKITSPPLKGLLAAVSVGLVDGEILLDLDYREDSRARVDLNIAADDRGRIADVQATAEGEAFEPQQLEQMTALGLVGVASLVQAQRLVLEAAGVELGALIQRPEDVK